MEQFPLQSNSQNSLKSHQIPSYPPHHPKIKPLLQRSYTQNQPKVTNYQKFLKTHLKNFRAIKTTTDLARNSLPRYIKGYRKILTTQDPLSQLFYSFNSNVYCENSYLFSKIKSLTSLKSLEVLFFSNWKRPIPLTVLFKNLAYLKNLTHFKIELNFYYFSETDAQALDTLFHSLQCLQKLKSLSLTFRGCYHFEKAKMKHLPEYLSYFKQLESLELNFNESRELTDQDITNLASVLPKLPLLTQIKLDFGSLDVEGRRRRIQGFNLVQLFQNIKTPSEITLNLGSSEIINQESTDSLTEGLRLLHAPSLKKLSLHLNKNLDTQNLIELSHTLKRFTSLNILHLNLFGCGTLTNEGVAQLGSALRSLPKLRSFNFRVHHTIQADSLIGCIASGLKPLHQLVNLKLRFASNLPSRPGQIQQLTVLLAGLTRLEFLEIWFSQEQSLPDEVMEKLSESLQKLTVLKHLTLNFERANMLTNKGVEALVSAIRNLYTLSFLDLNFSGKEEIDEKAIDNIAQVLKYLPCLYSLRLIFCQCPKLRKQKKSFSSLFDALRQVQNIKEVTLNLTRNEFTEQEIQDLQQRKILDNTWCL